MVLILAACLWQAGGVIGAGEYRTQLTLENAGSWKDWLTLDSAKFDPYADNGGGIVGLAGPDYCLIAADTRLSENYMIRSRLTSRIYQVRAAASPTLLSLHELRPHPHLLPDSMSTDPPSCS